MHVGEVSYAGHGFSTTAMPDLLRAGADEALACCWGMEINPLPREAVLIVNVHSRKGEALFAQAKEKLEQGGVRLIAAHAVHDPDRWSSWAAVMDRCPERSMNWWGKIACSASCRSERRTALPARLASRSIWKVRWR
jgi:hypothetical protein